MRTRQEIRERLKGQVGMLNFATDDLVIYLPEEVGGDRESKEPPTDEEAMALIREYLPFAFEKALDHRGLSANRSIDHLRNYAWLAGRDDLLAFAESDANYANYGVPILKEFARAVDISMPVEIENWPDGEACRPGCENGCGQRRDSRRKFLALLS